MATHRPSELLPLAVSAPGVEVDRGEPDRLLTVHFDGDTSLLALPIPERPRFLAYRVEIRSAGGQLLLEASLTPTVAVTPPTQPTGPAIAPPPRLLSLVLPARSLAPGDYRLRILGLRGGRGEGLAEHPLRVIGP
jgi:hypothetical protein